MPKRLSRRRLLTGLSSALAASLLASCGSAAASPAPTPLPSPSPAPPPSPVPATPGDAQADAQPESLLDRRPYLQDISATGVVISWRLHEALPSWIEVGPAGGALRRIDVPPGTSASVTIDDLTPATSYEYQVGAGEQTLTPRTTFRSAPDGDAGFSFVVFGDSGKGTDIQRELAARIKALAPDIVLHTGDVVYGDPPHFDKRYFNIYADLLATTAVFPAIGDNDAEAGGGAEFREAFVLPPGAPAAGGAWAYSFDYGPAHFVALDTESDYGANSPQTRWLADDLARTQQAWKFVFFHRPAYAASNERDHDKIRKAWAPLFERYGVAAAFSGHDHNYQRSRPIRDYSSGLGGVVYVITGGGGAELREVTADDPVVYAESVNHVVSVHVAGDTATVTAVKADGGVIDTFELPRPA